MAAQTGRTVSKWTRFVVDDSAGTLREIPISSINGVGLTHDEKESWALQDAIKTVLSDTPDCAIEVTGPFDTAAAVAAAGSAATPTLSGSHTVLTGIVGLSVPLSLGVYIGVRHYWETGEPTFGISSSATAGFVCTSYVIDPAAMTYTAKFRVYPASTAPAWGTAIIT